jgi:hypothetical protein
LTYLLLAWILFHGVDKLAVRSVNGPSLPNPLALSTERRGDPMKTIGACMLVLVMIIGCDDDSSGNNGTNNVNNVNNNINNINNLNNVDLCAGIDCSGHGACVVDGQGLAACDCDPGYEADGLACVSSTDPCAGIGCSGHGTCVNEAVPPVMSASPPPAPPPARA